MADLGIKELHISTDATWASPATGTWAEVDLGSVLLDQSVIMETEEFVTEMADNMKRQDGLRATGRIRHEPGATNIPAINTAFWIKVVPFSGTGRYYGGVNGFIGRILPTGLKALSSGRPYDDLVYETVGVDKAALVAAVA